MTTENQLRTYLAAHGNDQNELDGLLAAERANRVSPPLPAPTVGAAQPNAEETLDALASELPARNFRPPPMDRTNELFDQFRTFQQTDMQRKIDAEAEVRGVLDKEPEEIPLWQQILGTIGDGLMGINQGMQGKDPAAFRRAREHHAERVSPRESAMLSLYGPMATQEDAPGAAAAAGVFGGLEGEATRNAISGGHLNVAHDNAETQRGHLGVSQRGAAVAERGADLDQNTEAFRQKLAIEQLTREWPDKERVIFEQLMSVVRDPTQVQLLLEFARTMSSTDAQAAGAAQARATADAITEGAQLERGLRESFNNSRPSAQ